MSAIRRACSSAAPAVLVLFGALFLGGCDEEKRQERIDRKTAKDRAQDGARRCGDFLSEQEAQSLGVENYRPGKGDTNPLRGVVCTTRPVILTVFMAERYDTMLAGARALKDMKEIEGPELGQKTFWFEALDVKQVMFVSEKGDFAFGVSGEDQKVVEKAARLASEGR